MKIPDSLFKTQTVRLEPNIAALKSLDKGERAQLARELAEANGTKYESAQRRLQRYITEGKEKRRAGKTELPADVARAIKDKLPDKVPTKKVTPADNVEIEFKGRVRMSGKEKTRERTMKYAVDRDTLEEMAGEEDRDEQLKLLFGSQGINADGLSVDSVSRFRWKVKK